MEEVGDRAWPSRTHPARPGAAMAVADPAAGRKTASARPAVGRRTEDDRETAGVTRRRRAGVTGPRRAGGRGAPGGPDRMFPAAVEGVGRPQPVDPGDRCHAADPHLRGTAAGRVIVDPAVCSTWAGLVDPRACPGATLRGGLPRGGLRRGGRRRAHLFEPLRSGVDLAAASARMPATLAVRRRGSRSRGGPGRPRVGAASRVLAGATVAADRSEVRASLAAGRVASWAVPARLPPRDQPRPASTRRRQR